VKPLLKGEGAFEWWVYRKVFGCHSREGRQDISVGRSSSI